MNGIQLKTNIKPVNQGMLSDISVSIKDCICIKDVETKSSSQILSGYKPNFNATIVDKLLLNGATIIGKTIQDEFGFGSFGVNSSYKITNPLDNTRVPGGSSSGSAVAAKTIKKHLAIAESTGGSIVNPAAFCSVYGLCPTYGLISRYGLLDYANSLDKIGLMSTDLGTIRKGLKVIAGYDEKDSTSVKLNTYPDYLTKNNKQKYSFIVINEFIANLDDKIKEAFENKIKELSSKGHSISYISMPFIEKYSIPSYYIIALSESSTNLARYSGIRYGVQSNMDMHYNKYFEKIRSQNFSKESKRRIILGTFTRMAGYRDAYYIKALKVRTLIIQKLKDLLEKYDAIIHPTMPILPPKISEVENLKPIEVYNMDLLTVPANLAGLPHLSVPIKEMIGFMITTNHFEEKKLLDIGDII